MPHDDDKKPNLHVVSNSLNDPPIAGTPDPVKKAGGRKTRAKRTKRQHGEIFVNAPVMAIGQDGDVFIYLDTLGQVRLVTNHTKDTIRGIFGGNIELLKKVFPSRNKDGAVTGFKQEDLAGAMQNACTEQGIVDMTQRVRETGTWLDENDDLIWHCGDQVLMRGERGGDKWLPPGLIGEHVYPAKPRAPRPADCSLEEARTAAAELLAQLETWNWARGDLDARLAMGWIGCSIVGGALDWRPMGWVTGDAATGKSTLQRLVHDLLGGDAGIVTASDATEAGLRQLMMHSTRPVWLDEAEAEDDNRKLMAIVKLARQSSSSGTVVRGGAEHKGQTFTIRAAMMFSSILVPPIPDQDLSRIAILKLRPLVQGAAPPVRKASHWSGLGARLRRLIWAEWPEWQGFLEHYRMALIRAGHNDRGADQFGTLLAMADLMLSPDEPSPDFSAELAEKLSAGVVDAEIGKTHDWVRCITHLFSQPIEQHRGGTKHNVGEWIQAAADLEEIDGINSPKDADRSLRRIGLSVEGRREHAVLLFANTHAGLNGFFRDTRWAGGVHRQAFERIEGFHVPEKNSRTWGGLRVRVSAFPLAATGLLDDLEDTPF